MGSVLSFQPRNAATVRKQPVVGGASIVIFPGVRYERHEAAHQSRLPRSEVRREKPEPRH